jgi:hypothetical protein
MTMPINRLDKAHHRGGLAAHVGLLIDAIAHRDRWRIARRATGDLLDELLSGAYDDVYGEPGTDVGLDGAPVVMVDDGMAVVIAAARGGGIEQPVPVCALLTQSSNPDHGWLVGALTQEHLLDNSFQRRVQHNEFTPEEDAAIIAGHMPLDEEAASIDWNDDATIVRRVPSALITVADARSEAEEMPRERWAWEADNRYSFAALYLRASHPELVRESSQRDTRAWTGLAPDNDK